MGVVKKNKKRMSMMTTTTAASRRQSVASSASNMRRKSVVGGPGVKNDPRPLTDKGFVRQSIENLIRFLAERGYDQAVSPKILHRPTGKDFENVTLFLFSRLDRNHKFAGKFPDEVTAMFKALKYPFNISKTSLAAVGSPHTWPALLASLAWLVELLDYDQITGLNNPNDFQENGDEDMDKAFFVYLRKAYESFLCGDDNRYEILDQELVQTFRQRDKLIEDDIKQIERKRESLERQYEEESSSTSMIPELEQRKRDFQGDKLKWDKLIRQFEENREILTQKAKERELERRSKEEDLQQAQRVKDEIQRVLDQQEVNPADAERMNHERRALDSAQNSLMEERDGIQKSIWATEMSISKQQEQVERLVEEYNRIATAMRLKGADITVKLDAKLHAIVRDDGSGSLDVSKIKTALQDLNEMSLKKTHQIRTENLELQVQADENEEEKSAIQEIISNLEQNLSNAETQHDKEKRELEAELARKSSDTELIEEEIHMLRNESELLQGPLREEKEMLETLCKEAELEAAKHEDILAQMETKLETALDAYVSYKESVEGLLKSLRTTLSEKLEQAQITCETSTSTMADAASWTE